LVDFLSSLCLTILLSFIDCELFGFCICLKREEFINPVARMSRLGVLNYDDPFNENAGYSLVDLKDAKKY